MELVSFDPVWFPDTANEPSFFSNYEDFREHWSMDLSEWITNPTTLGSNDSVAMTASPQAQPTSVLCGAFDVSQALTDEVATHGSRTEFHCNQVGPYLASQELPLKIVTQFQSSPQCEACDGWAAVDACPNKLLDAPTSGQEMATDLTHSQIPDRQDLTDEPSNKETEAQSSIGEDRDLLRDLPSAVLERKITGSDAPSSGQDATYDIVPEQRNRSAEADSVPRELSIEEAKEQRCEDEANSASNSPRERGPDNMTIGSSDQEWITQRLEKVQQTTETSGDDQLRFKDDSILPDVGRASPEPPTRKSGGTEGEVDKGDSKTLLAHEPLRRSARATRKRRSDDTQLWGTHDFEAKILEELVKTWAKLQPDLLFEIADLIRMSGNSGNQLEGLAEDFLDEITSLYQTFDALQGDKSTSTPHLADCMLEPMRCWRELKKKLCTNSVLEADEEDERIVRRFGQALESLDAAATVYDSVVKYPYSIDIGDSNGDRAYGSRPRKRQRR